MSTCAQSSCSPTINPLDKSSSDGRLRTTLYTSLTAVVQPQDLVLGLKLWGKRISNEEDSELYSVEASTEPKEKQTVIFALEEAEDTDDSDNDERDLSLILTAANSASTAEALLSDFARSSLAAYLKKHPSILPGNFSYSPNTEVIFDEARIDGSCLPEKDGRWLWLEFLLYNPSEQVIRSPVQAQASLTTSARSPSRPISKMRAAAGGRGGAYIRSRSGLSNMTLADESDGDEQRDAGGAKEAN